MSNITNLNRDYLIKINVKEATIDVPKMAFWNTDQKTSNMFVQLVINMSTNELISNYVTVQNATDYKIKLNVIKPKTNQYKTIEATLLNEEKALFEIDLPDEFTDQVGDYSFEFEVSSKVDSNDESITTSNGTYKVNGSILTNLNEETSSSPDLPILKQLIEQVKSLQGGDLTGYQKKNDAAQKTIVEDGKLYLTKLDGTKLDDGTTLPTGSGTSIDDTNTTTDKTWSSSKIDSQFKDIANKTIVEGNKIYLAKADGTKLDEGTDLPTSSGEKGDPGKSVTISSVVESTEDGGNNVVTFSDGTVLNVKNGSKGNKGDSGSAGGNDNSLGIETYKVEDIGELYVAPSNYTAWCAGDLHFDKKLDKFVVLLFCAPAHVHNSSNLYVSYIDKNDFIATTPQKCKYVDSDGTTDITPTKAGICSFIILQDGTYLMIHSISDGTIHRFVSTDNGVTWKSTNVLTNTFNSPWKIKELSNGRLICSDDSKRVGFMYSDNKGVTWSKVIPVTCNGDYEAEADIIELEPNKLMAIARKNMNGAGYDFSGDSDHAIISYSNDNGNTWTPWKESATLDNMNASCCTTIVHDGIVEVFACSRWYKIGSYTNTDNINTGKTGAMFHYVATLENAKNDNFTKIGLVEYARGNADEYHSPCIAKDNNNNILIVHMDKGKDVLCNHRYIRGSLNNLSYLATDGSSTPLKSYSAKYTDMLLQNVIDKVNLLQYAVSQIPGSGVDAPTGTLLWTKKYIAEEESSSFGLSTNKNTIRENCTNWYPTNTNENSFGVDSDGKKYCTICELYFAFATEKDNCAVELISVLKNSNNNVFMGIVKNGQLYALRNTNGLKANVKKSYKIIKEGEKMYFYIDGNKITTPDPIDPSTLEKISNIYSLLKISAFDANKTYIIGYPSTGNPQIYEFKLGEWNS